MSIDHENEDRSESIENLRQKKRRLNRRFLISESKFRLERHTVTESRHTKQHWN